MVKIGPIHGHKDILTAGDLVRHPVGETVPHVDAVVAEQAVHLLDRVLGHQATGLGQRVADHRHPAYITAAELREIVPYMRTMASAEPSDEVRFALQRLADHHADAAF